MKNDSYIEDMIVKSISEAIDKATKSGIIDPDSLPKASIEEIRQTSEGCWDIKLRVPRWWPK
jgi:hypothetical protein